MLHALSYMYNNETGQPAPEHAAEVLVAEYSKSSSSFQICTQAVPKKKPCHVVLKLGLCSVSICCFFNPHVHVMSFQVASSCDGWRVHRI